MELKIDNLMRKIALPKRYFNNDFIISDKFREETDTFISLLHQCSCKEFNVDQEEKIKQNLAEICDIALLNISSVLNIINYYENADLKTAQEEFDILMSRIKDDIFISSIDDWVQITTKEQNFWTQFRITPGYRYFRVRPSEYESYTISLNADELFHIPLSKRAYSNNERFSLAGFPSLYLSTMLPLAWQECGYPQKYYYSEYQFEHCYDSTFEKRLVDKELRFLSLYSPDEICNWGSSVKHNNFDHWLEVVTKYLKSYPLILACSFVNQSGKVPYKQEYIIPQMLMQWVQRNNLTVQGISYFTCIDTSMWPSQWCAYNIAIPAMAPYDDKMYSSILREKFCWTVPQFFTVPIADKKNNEHDREIIYSFVSDIRSAIRTYQFPMKLLDILNKMMNISGCLMSLLDNGSAQHMQLALHILNSLYSNCSQLKTFRLENLIDEVLQDKQDLNLINNLNLYDAINTFRNLYNRFIGDIETDESIEKIIDNYKMLCWNDLHPHSEIILIYTNETEITEPLKWLHEKHVLHFLKKLDSSDNTVKYLKQIAEEAKVSIQDFWDIPIGNDEWIKMNINEIKTPIFIKQNDVSIFSPDGTAFYEFVQIGFNKDILAEKLNV
ncbi:MAG: hypothetical protein PHH84_02185 [Oscillospiraceae bacterium]|nr:hypothetical protein [Oscillospiraceae bacterium]MDD4413418.1 hypothetical protein [Oscillospiraceae bacterium]